MSIAHPTPEPDWLAVAAASVEAQPFLEHSDDHALAVACVGVGRAGDEPLAEALERQRPAAAINVGVAGALAPDLAPGDVVVIRAWVDPEGPSADPSGPLSNAGARDSLESDAALRASLAAALRHAGIGLRVGLAVTVDAPLHGRALRDALHASTGADIVEMEGARWARIASSAGVPFAAIRVVSDRADLMLPRPRHELMSAEGRVRWMRWMAAVLRSGRWRAPIRELGKLRRARRDWLAAMASLRALPAVLAGAATASSTDD